MTSTGRRRCVVVSAVLVRTKRRAGSRADRFSASLPSRSNARSRVRVSWSSSRVVSPKLRPSRRRRSATQTLRESARGRKFEFDLPAPAWGRAAAGAATP